MRRRTILCAWMMTLALGAFARTDAFIPERAFWHVGKGGYVIDVTKPPFSAKGDGVTDTVSQTWPALALNNQMGWAHIRYELVWRPEEEEALGKVFIDNRFPHLHGNNADGKLGDEVVSETEEFILVSTELKGFRQNGQPVPEVAAACAANDEFTVDFVRVYDFAE